MLFLLMQYIYLDLVKLWHLGLSLKKLKTYGKSTPL